jgi:hypothetical protein
LQEINALLKVLQVKLSIQDQISARGLQVKINLEINACSMNGWLNSKNPHPNEKFSGLWLPGDCGVFIKSVFVLSYALRNIIFRIFCFQVVNVNAITKVVSLVFCHRWNFPTHRRILF